MLKTLVHALGLVLLLVPAAMAGEEPIRLRLRLDVGQRYHFALAEDHQVEAGGEAWPSSPSMVEYTLEVIGKSPGGDYDVAMSYRLASDDRMSDRPAPKGPYTLAHHRLEEEGWRMTISDRGLIRELVGPPGMFRDLREKAAGSKRLQAELRHLERGIGDEGLRFMMQDDLALLLPEDEIVPGDGWETRGRLPTARVDELREVARHRFAGVDRSRQRPCARIVSEVDLEVVEAGEEVAEQVLGSRQASAGSTWRPLPSEASMERCVDLETGLPVEAVAPRFFGVEVTSAAATGRLTVRERDHLRAIDAPTGDAWIYWGRKGEIGRMRTDGSSPEILLRGNVYPTGIAVDETAGKVYWTDPGQGAVYRSDLDGSRVEEVFQGRGHPGGLAIAGDGLVWAGGSLRWLEKPTVDRSGPEGGEPRTLVEGGYYTVAGVAVSGDQIYFTTGSSKRVQRIGIDGSGHDDEVLSITDEKAALAVDGERICWLDDEDPAVWCSALDGGERIRVVHQDAEGLTGLTLRDGFLTWVASPTPWQGPSTFRRVSVDGGEVEDLLTTSGPVRGLAVTLESLFWTEDRQLRRYDFAERRLTTLGAAGAVGNVQRLASHDGKLYWLENGPEVGKLCRAGLDGSGVEDLVTGIRGPTGLAVVGSKLVWTEAHNDCVLKRANLDGTGVEEIKNCGRGRPDRLIAARGTLYWADSVLGYITSSKPDSAFQAPAVTLRSRFLELMKKRMSGEVESSAAPETVVVYRGQVYWTDSSNEKIVRADLDGSSREDLITGLEGPVDLVIDSDWIYWTDISPHRIRRARLDGSAVEDVVVVEDGHPKEVAVAGGRLYWTGITSDLEPFISRAGLDGSSPEILLSGDQVSGPGFQLSARRKELIVAFADDLVVAGGKLYWPEHAAERILRADLDGSNVEILVEGIRQSEGLATDDGWLYWTDANRDSVFRARLDGTGAEEIAEIEGSPQSLTVADGRLYWADLKDDRVRSAALDGSDVHDLFAGPSFPPPGYSVDELRPQSVSGLAVLADSIVWTDFTGGTIQRSRIGGSDADEVVSRLVLPRALRVHDADLYWVDGHGIQRARLAAPASPRLLSNRKGVEDLLIVVTPSP